MKYKTHLILELTAACFRITRTVNLNPDLTDENKEHDKKYDIV